MSAAARGPIGVGVIGMGVMGSTHARAYIEAAHKGKCLLVAAADPALAPGANATDARAAGNLGEAQRAAELPGEVSRYASADELLRDPRIDAVSICTHTDTHAPIALQALRAGKHVLIEKPVALTSAQADDVAREARQAGRIALAGMCMRFWPGWDWLRDRVQDRTLGALRWAHFERTGAPPAWSRGFYLNEARSGGAALDLHVHDADFICAAIGRPARVCSRGDRRMLTTLYDLGQGGPLVSALGGWFDVPGVTFRMRYRAAFEHAVAEWDLNREPRLVLTRDGRTQDVDVGLGAGYEPLIAHFLNAVQRNDHAASPTVQEAADVLRVVEAELRSAERGQWIDVEASPIGARTAGAGQ